MSTDHEANPGQVTWHSSGPGNGPDVGVSLGLGAGRMLWVGELAAQTLLDAGISNPALGWWVAIFGPKDCKPIAPVHDREAAGELLEHLAQVIGSPALRDPLVVKVLEDARQADDALVPFKVNGETMGVIRGSAVLGVYAGGEVSIGYRAPVETIRDLDPDYDPDPIGPGAPRAKR